jgi:ribosomal protein S8
MVRISVLGDALKTMYNAEKRGKRQVLIRPSSKVVIKFLQVMMKKGASLHLYLANVCCLGNAAMPAL